MKKTLRSLFLVVIFLALAVVPVLAGCDKGEDDLDKPNNPPPASGDTYEVNISVYNNLQNAVTITDFYTDENILGSNVVNEGERLVLDIKANPGYYLYTITINGKEKEFTHKKKDYIYVLDDVNENYDIVIELKEDYFRVELYSGEHTGRKWLYKAYTVDYNVLFSDLIDFGENIEDVFYYLDESTNEKIYINTSEPLDVWSIGVYAKAFKIYTLKTVEELNDMKSSAIS